MVDDGDPFTQFFGFLQIVRGQHNRHALAVEFADIGPKLLAQFNVHPSRWFIKDKDWRGMDHRLGNEQTPLHPARQGARIGMSLVFQMDGAQQFQRAAFPLGHPV